MSIPPIVGRNRKKVLKIVLGWTLAASAYGAGTDHDHEDRYAFSQRAGGTVAAKIWHDSVFFLDDQNYPGKTFVISRDYYRESKKVIYSTIFHGEITEPVRSCVGTKMGELVGHWASLSRDRPVGEFFAQDRGLNILATVTVLPRLVAFTEAVIEEVKSAKNDAKGERRGESLAINWLAYGLGEQTSSPEPLHEVDERDLTYYDQAWRHCWKTMFGGQP